MDYIEESNALTAGIYASLVHLGADIAELESENEGDELIIRSGKYTPEGIAEIQNEINSRRMAIDDKKRTLSNSLNSKIDEFVKTCTPSLNPAEITDDARLLTCGVKLTARELETLLERNKGNYTMETILLRYADENGLPCTDLKAKYRTAFLLEDISKVAQGERDRLKYALNHLGKKNWKRTINQFYGVIDRE